MNAQKVPAAAVKCAMTTTEVLRVIVGAGTVYKTIKSLVLVSISIKSNYVELTCQMMCISLILKLNCLVCKLFFFKSNVSAAEMKEPIVS